MEEGNVSGSLELNEKFLREKIGESFDIKYRHFKIPAYDGSEALIVYIDGLADARVIDDTILEPLIKNTDSIKSKIFNGGRSRLAGLADKGVYTKGVQELKLWDEICDAVLEGDTALFIEHCPAALVLTTRKYEGRAVNEPSTEAEIKGPRDGFVESIETNASLIRRRIKDFRLRFVDMKIGERTKTVVSVAYIDGLADEALVDEVKQRLGRIKVDGIMSSENIEELIEDTPYSVFPTIASTERPDKVCSALLEGRVAVLVDNTPFVLVIPAVFWQFLTGSGDYYEKFHLATFFRWIRIIAMFLSISASSLYVLLTSYHQEMLPTALAMNIAAGRNGVPFPAILEAVIMELILEIMKEAGLRLPKPMGEAVSIVGTLVIGQAAVSAGIVGPFLVIVIAVAAISSFAIPSYSMSNTFRLIRFPVLFSTAIFGLLGYLAGIIIIILYLMSLRSFGSPYLAPVMPFSGSGNKDVFIRVPWWKMKTRPGFVSAQQDTRQADGIKGGPPPDKRKLKERR